MLIRPMSASDWPQVRDIYAAGIACGLATFETDPPDWETWNAGHHEFARLVAEEAGCVIGWAALSPVSKRRCYSGVAEVSVYVAPTVRGRGVGTALLRAVVEESERAGIWTLQGATFAENAVSLALQRACGFRIVGRRERIAQRLGVWHNTIVTERRSTLVEPA